MAIDVLESGEDKKWDDHWECGRPRECGRPARNLESDSFLESERPARNLESDSFLESDRPARNLESDSFLESGRPAHNIEDHYRGYLPHIENKQFQFITFNLFDAVPTKLIQQWKEELNIVDTDDQNSPECIEFINRIEKYKDKGFGSSFMKEPQIASIVQNALLYFNNKRYLLVEWCIMPNHVHILIEVFAGYSLSEILHSWKSFTAHEANKKLNRKGNFWSQEYFDRYIRDSKQFEATVKYIRNNSVKAGLVESYQAWQWRGSIEEA